MSKNSTPGVSAPSTSTSTRAAMCRPTSGPREATLKRLRQFARAYSAPVPGFAGVVLN